MYKVFIVDDEVNTRSGLIELFDWAKWDIQVVGEADNGVTAIDKILALKPDVVLSDIKMPMLGGVELAKKLKESAPEIKIIFISGYDDTEYLKSALELDVIDYIFKPVDFDELESVIKKVLNIIDVEVTAKQKQMDMNQKLIQSMPLLQDKFYLNLIKNTYTSLEQIRKQTDFLGIDLPAGSQYCIMVVEIDDYPLFLEKISEKDRQLMSFGTINIFQEIVNNVMDGYVFENEPGEYIAIIKLRDADSNDYLYTLANDVKENLLKYLDMSITVGIGSSVEGLLGLASSYKMASKALNHKLYLGKNRIITIDIIEENNHGTFQFDFDKWNKTEALLSAAHKGPVREYLEKLFLELSRIKKADKQFYQTVCIQLAILAEQLLYKLDIKLQEENSTIFNMLEKIYKLDTIDDMKKTIMGYYSGVCELIQNKRESKSSNVIESIKKIIGERYADKLTIEELAEEVYLTPTYLCLLFKQETDLTINEYRTNVRIEHAKAMLKDLSNKVYDISYAVGYENPSYFSLQFKKIVGIGPKEFRDKFL